jgi:pimeloyl-ACP methyl ester carboxylesterase
VSHSIAGLIGRQYTQRYPGEVAGLVMVDTAPDDWDIYNGQGVFTSGGESLDITEVAGALRASGQLGDRPVVVVKAARTSEISPAPEFAGYWESAQRRLAGLSTNSMYVVAANSNHGVPASQPALVRAAIDLVVRAARSGDALPACAASTLPPLGGTC